LCRDGFESDGDRCAFFAIDNTALRVAALEETHPHVGDAVFLPEQPMDLRVCLGIRLRAVPPAFAASIDLDKRVRVHVLNPPPSVGAAGVNPGILSLVDDPEPPLVHYSGWSRLAYDNDLSANFDQGQVCKDISHAYADDDPQNDYYF